MSSKAADVVVAASRTQVASCIRRVRSLQPNLDRSCDDSISNESSAYTLSSGRLKITAGAVRPSTISEINAGLISQKGVLHHRLSKARWLDLSRCSNGVPPDSRQQFVPFSPPASGGPSQRMATLDGRLSPAPKTPEPWQLGRAAWALYRRRLSDRGARKSESPARAQAYETRCRLKGRRLSKNLSTRRRAGNQPLLKRAPVLATGPQFCQEAFVCTLSVLVCCVAVCPKSNS